MKNFVPSFIPACVASVFLFASPAFALPDWFVSVTDPGQDGLPAGSTLVYTVDINNASFTDDAPETTVTFDIDDGNTMVDGGGLLNCVGLDVLGPTQVTCDVPEIPADSGLQFFPEVLTSAFGTTNFTATVPTTGDGGPSVNTATQPTSVVRGADIVVSVDAPATAASGQFIDYTFTLENNGPDPSDGFDFTFNIPAGMANVTAPDGCTQVGQTFECAIPGVIDVGPDNAIDLTFNGQIVVASPGEVTDTAAVSNGSPGDGQSDNNVVTFSTLIDPGSDVTIAKSAADTVILVGEETTFTLSPSYFGDDPTGLEITDVIPDNYTIVDVDDSGSPFVCPVPGNNTVTCTLAAGSGTPDPVTGEVSLGNILITVLAVEANEENDPTENVASISSEGPIDPNPGNNTAGDGGVDLQDPFVDHVAGKTGPNPRLVAVGSVYDYRLSTTNTGNADFFGTLVIEDTFPDSLTLDSVNENGWTCDPVVPAAAPGFSTIVCRITYDDDIGPLAPGAAAPVITTSMLVNETGPISNTMVVRTDDQNLDDTDLNNNIVTYNVEGQEADSSADISIAKTALPNNVPATNPPSLLSGEIQTFVIEVINNGPADPADPDVDSLDVVVTDTISNLINDGDGPGDGFVSFAIDPQGATGFSCSTAPAGSGRALTCNIDALPVCAVGVDCPTVTVEVRPGGDPSVRTNTAVIRSDTTADTNQNNNRSSANYEVLEQTDVTVAKSVSPDPSVVGQDVVYVITAENRPTNADGDPISLSTANEVEIVDTLPADLTFVSAVPSAGSCSVEPDEGSVTGPANNQLVCELGDIPNNSQQTVTVTVRPNNETLNNVPPSITNEVAITTSTPEADTTNNDASVESAIVEPSFDLVVNKLDTVDPVGVNEETVYQVEVINFGPSAAENVVLTDNMPETGIAFQSVSSSDSSVVCTDTSSDPGATPAAGIDDGFLDVDVTCTIPYLEPGRANAVLIEIVAKGDVRGSYTNEANVTADGAASFEANADNNEIEHGTNVRSRVDLAITKDDLPAVNVRDNFDWTVSVENIENAALFYGIAEDVVVSDTLPNNMILTAAPTWPVSPTQPAGGTCTVAANNRTFTCEIGEMAIGETIDITAPSRVDTVNAASEPQTFSNTATVTTSSLDSEQDNNSNTGTIDVNWSSISGTIFRDFNDDGTQAATDTPLAGIELFINGTDQNGNPVEQIRVVTDANGNYTFDFLPEGNYVITRGDIDEPFQTDGQNRDGSDDTLYTGNDSPPIALAGNDDLSNYDFAVVPQARIGLAKEAGTPTLNADGTFDVTFTFAIENFSLEELNSVTLEDQLAGGPDLFGAYTTLDTGMPRGSYTVLPGASSACGTVNTDFTGDTGQLILVSDAVIAAGGTCAASVTLRINPTDPLPVTDPQYLNSATVDGVGTLSGQTSATNPLLNDISNDGTDADPSGNTAANDADEDTPTPVTADLSTSVVLEKTVDTSAIADPTAPVPGEELTYTYTVRNPTAFNVFDINVVENAPGPQAANSPPNFSGTGTPPVIGAPTGGADIDLDGDLPDLPPNGSLTYTATYQITQDDIDAGFVLNTATLTATDVYGEPLTDFSDDPTVADAEDFNSDGLADDPTVAPLARIARLEVAKSIPSESFTDPALQAGDTIEYQFIVTNTGNTRIAAVTPVDPGPLFGGVPGTGADLVFETTDDTDLDPTEFATFTATYTLTSVDVGNLYASASWTDGIANAATADGTPPTGTTIVTNTDTTETGDTPTPIIELTKEITAVTDANGNGILGDAGDTVTYDFEVFNNGNTSLANIRIDDPALDLVNARLTQPSLNPALAPGESGTLTGLVYEITPLNLAQGNVVNTAAVSATPVATNTNGTANAGVPLVDGDGAALDPVTDDSDTRTDPVPGETGAVAPSDDPTGDGDDNATVVNLPVVEADITITKRVDSVADTNDNETLGDTGDIITYTLVVTNTGTTSLADVLVTDDKLGLSQNVGDLAIGASATLTGLEYAITVPDQADQQVVNTAEAAGDPVATGPGNVPNPASPLVDADNNDLEDVTDLSDTLTEPDFDADGNVADVDDPNAGNSFDDPTIVNLPSTGSGIVITKAISEVLDANGNGVLGDAGDTIAYDFVVTNNGNASLAGVTVTDDKLELGPEPVEPADLLPGASGTLTGQIYTITAEDQGVLVVENSALAEGQPVATDPVTNQPDPDTPLTDSDGNNLPVARDFSDTRTDPDLDANGNVVTTADPDADNNDNAPTLLNLPEADPAITLTKAITAVNDVNGNGLLGDVGDTIEYEFVITNTGNTSLAGIVLNDDKLGLVDASPTPDALPIDGSVTFVPAVAYEITVPDQAAGVVENTAIVDGNPVETGPGNVPLAGQPLLDADGAALEPVDDTSDTLTDPDLNDAGEPVLVDDPAADGDDNPTLLNLPEPVPGIVLTKRVADVIDTNSTGIFGDVGDEVLYTFEATNTGNTALANVAITDELLELEDVPMVEPAILPGETAVLENQSYFITPLDVAIGSVENMATVAGAPAATGADGQPDPDQLLENPDGTLLDPVEDMSDTLTDPDLDADGNPVPTDDPAADGDNTPTLLNLPEPVPGIVLTKRIADVIDTNSTGIFGDAGDEVLYTFEATNTGNTALANVSITDELLELDEEPMVESALLPNETAVLENQSYFITPLDVANGSVENTATVFGDPVATGADGQPDPATPLVDTDDAPLDPVDDMSDTLTDPDLDAAGNPVPTDDPAADGDDTPTLLNLPEQEPGIVLTKRIADVIDTNGNDLFGDLGDEILYTLEATNTGNTALANVVLTDELLGLDAEPMVPSSLLPGETAVLENLSYFIDEDDAAARFVENTADVAGSPVATGPDGQPDADTPLVDTDDVALDPVEDVSDTLTDPDLDADGNPVPTDDPASDGDDTPTLLNLPGPPSGLVLTKTVVGNSQVLIGDTVTYSIVVANPTTQDAIDINIEDTLPPGLLYTPGTATLDGVATTPDVVGRTITFTGVSILIDQEVEIILSTRVTAQADQGDLTNRVVARDPFDDAPLSETATAVITLMPEAVFNCTAVIGKVFDDRNMNGYQDEVGDNSRVSNQGITDQNFLNGKIGNEIVETNEGEPGLPYVRLATPTGTIITTDEYGRYSIPCAELPADAGTNFSLKLDTRSLPTGYRVTTENPRTMRLSAGIFAEMNFGAAIGRVVDVNLTDAAFVAGRNQPTDALSNGLDGLLDQIQDTPSILRISYFVMSGAEDDRARARMAEVEDLIRDKWRGVGRYRLVIERTVKRFQ
ncbi:MAG: SdrD B-like domain-containing protein [Pseudomonadota bacterium]